MSNDKTRAALAAARNGNANGNGNGRSGYGNRSRAWTPPPDPDPIPELDDREPTGKVPHQLVLLEGGAKSGKSFEMAKLSGSKRVGRSWWLDLGEGTGDQYGRGKVAGSRYRMINHDGTMRSIIGQCRAVAEQARLDFETGKPPVCLFIDSGTLIWEGLKRRAHARAKRTYTNREKLANNPDAEITVSHNFWNDANRDWRDLMTILLRFKGIVVVSARGKEVTKFEDGKPVEDGEKDYRVQGQRDLAFDASVWVRLSRDAKPLIVGARSLHAGVKPGKLGDPPREVTNGVFSLEWLLFDVLKYDPQDTESRDVVDVDSEDAGESTRHRAVPGERITVDPDQTASPFDDLDQGDDADPAADDEAEAEALRFGQYAEAVFLARGNDATTRADVEGLWREGVENEWLARPIDPDDPSVTPGAVLTQAAHNVKARENRAEVTR